VVLSPANQLTQEPHEIGATRRCVVLLVRRPLQIAATLDEPGPLESLEPIRKDVAGDAFRDARKSAKRFLS
jgi:hypothetical protein